MNGSSDITEAGLGDSADTGASTIVSEVLLPDPIPELLTGHERRRRWTEQQKLQLLAETFRPGHSISHVARRYGVHTSVLFRWRRQFAEPIAKTVLPALSPPAFAAVKVVQPPAIPTSAALPATAQQAGMIEIELAAGHRLRVDRHVDAEALRRVLSALASG